MTLCCVRGVWLPQLPGGYLWLLCSTRYCMILCCVRGVRLPQLPGGYLWLPLVTSVTRLHDSMLCTWWVPMVTFGYLVPYRECG